MNHILQYTCTICHTNYPKDNPYLTCPKCGETGILTIDFDLQTIKKTFTKESLMNNPELSMFRYIDLLPIDPFDYTTSLRVGWTPLYEAKSLAKELNIKKLYVKDEGLNPTQSMKDRASVIAVRKAIEENKSVIACSSTGNAASSLAGNAAKANLKTVIFVPKRAPVGKLSQLLVYGSLVFKVDGDYKDAFQLSKQAIDYYGWYNRNAAINPNLIEGKKTVVFEILEQLHFEPTDWIVISVGDGCSVGGVYKGLVEFYELGLITKIPKILGVQSQGCKPFVDSWRDHLPLQEAEEQTIADSISVGIPRNPIKAIEAIEKTGGIWIDPTDEEILQAIAMLGRLEGIFTEPASAASVAGAKKALQEGLILPNETMTIILTGNGLKDTTNALKAVNEPMLMKPSLEELQKYMIRRGVKHE